MKILYNWLKEFISVSEDVNGLANILYNLGFGIESVVDDVIDLEITPNRGDGLSIYGIAREYGAFKKKLINPYKTIDLDSSVRHLDNVIEIKSKQLTSYYGLVLDNIIAPKTPYEVLSRLKKIDINSVNCIVDITNYIMHETGIPLHAYDLDKIKNKIRIELSDKTEKIVALNKKEYSLAKDTLVAYDGDKVIDIVGIMGGLGVGVDCNTKRILLQAANIDSKLIRSTSKFLNLNTPASYRYERGIDNNMLKVAVLRAH